MAANDVLKIGVQIVEDDKKNVESLVKKVQLMLDKDFKLKVSDEGALKKLEEMLSVLKSIETQMSSISKGLSNSSFGKLGEDLNIAITEFRKLTASAEEFGRSMSKSFSSSLKSELDALLPKLSETAKVLEKVKSESRSADGSGGIVTSVQSIREAVAKLASTLTLMEKLQNAENRLGEKGFNTTQLERYRQELSQIAVELQKIKGSSDGTSSGLTTKEFLKSAGFTSLAESARQELKSFQDAESVMSSMSKLADEIKSKLNSLSDSNPLRANLESAIRDLENWQALIARNPRDIGQDTENRNQKMKEYQNLLDSAVQKEREIQKAIADSAKSEEQMKKSVNDATKEADRLGRQLAEVDNIIKRSKELKLDTTSIEKARAELESLKNLYSAMARNGGTNGPFGSFTELKGHSSTVATERDIKDAIDQANKAIKDEERSIKKNEQTKREAAKSAEKLSAEEQKLSNAMRQTNQQGFLQTNVLNDLKSMATQYLSIWGAKSFVENMAQITGELELQQKSLEVIIGSASYASQLFGEIRDLSQQSPYTFQDLLKSTRQLAAFGIETKDLYGTMKSLSDIGAGLSVDVQRLILAYGHTKSYGYLSGIQNRQFETAGIDLVGALADRYNKLADAEERAGRAAEHVTRKDVFKMISKKEVGFEDVNAVIMGLDAPGGRFYNMQERQFETLGGKLRNLRNNYNIMMAEMGKANHGMLMGGVNMLNELTKHWDKYARIITAILVPLGAFRLATLAVNSAVGLQSDAMAKNVMAMVKNKRATEAAVTAMNSGGFLSAIRGGLAASGSFMPSKSEKDSFAKVLNKGYSNGSITKSQLMMMGLNKDLPKVYRQIALSIAGVDRAQISTIASAKGWQRALLRLRYSLGMGAAAIRSFGAAIASLAVQMAPMAIIGGLVALYSHFKSMADETRESLDQLAKNAKEDAKSIDDTIAKYRERGVTQTGGTSYLNGNRIRSVGLSFDIDKIKEMTADDVEELKQELQKFSPFYEGDLVDISKFQTQAEQVMAIMRKLDSYRHAEQVIASSTGNYEESASGSFWGGGYDSFKENLEDMGKSMSKASAAVAKLSEEEVDNFDKELGGALSRAVKSGAAVNEAEALRQYLVRAMFMSGEDRQKIKDSWSNGLKKLYLKANYNGVWGKNTELNITSYRQSVSRLAETLQNDINKNYGANDIDGALKHAISVYESFAADAKGISEEAKQAGLQMLLQSVFGDGSNHKNAYIDFVNSEFAGEAYKEISESGAVNLWMKPEEIASKASEVIEKIKERWKGQGKDITKITKDTINSIVKTIQNDNTLENTWQKKLGGLGGEPLWKNFARFNSKRIKDNTMEADMWNEIRKRYKELQEKLDGEKLVMQTKFGIELKPEIFMDSSKILEQMKKLNTNGQFYKDKNGKWQVSFKNTGAAYDEYKRYLPLMNTFSELYYDLKGAEDRIVQLWDDKKNRGSGRGTYKDREYELWEQRVKIIQEARREYDYWEKAVGKESAQDKVKKQFDELISKSEDLKKALKPGDLDNLEKYRDVLIDVQNEARQRYEKNLRVPEKKRNDLQKLQLANDQKILRDIAKTMNDIDKMDFEKATEKFVSGMSLALDDLSRRWEIFNSIREKVGNDNVSARIAGLTHLDAGAAFASDAMRAEIDKFMKENAAAVEPIDFSKILGLDEDSLTKTVQQMFRVYTDSLYDVIASDEASNDEKEAAKKKLVDYEQRIKAVINALKEWQKAEKEIQKNAQEAYADVLGKAMDYASRIVRINANLKDQIDLLQKANNITPQQRNAAINRLQANAAWEREQVSGQFGRFFNSTFSESRNTMLDYANKLKGVLNNQFKTGAISAQKYADELNKIDEKMKEFDGDKMVNYFSNGLEKILQRRYEKGVEERDNGLEMQENGRNLFLQSNDLYKQSESIKFTDPKQSAELANQAQTLFSEGSVMSVMGSEMAAMGEGMMAGAQGGMQALAIVDQIVHGINDMVQSLKELKDDIYETLDSFGVDLNTDAAINASAFFDGFAEASEGATKAWESLKSGNVVGVAQGVVQSFTGWIKAFNAAHDKRREVRIQKINDQLTEMSNTLDAIRELRERELGYTSTSGLKGMGMQYFNQAIKSLKYGLIPDSATVAMANYYFRGSKEESAYAAEYNNLLEQRKLKMEQYNAEADKKKKDGSKLEQYKKDIADLDQQIQNFAEDLMNSLWGMDFKGWASQISDALMTAFENGTSMAQAFDETVEDIMRNMAKNMANLAIAEPFMKMLRDKVIGYTDENGNYHAGAVDIHDKSLLDNPQEYASTVAKATAEGMKELKDPLTTSMSEFYNSFNDMAKQYGFDLKSSGSSKSGSNSISQSITEETAGFMTGILAAMHQDGSVRRLQLQTLVAEQMPNVIEMMTVDGNHIAGIDENTRAIMHMMQDGTGRMYERIDYIGNKLDRFSSGFDRISIN